MSENIQSLANKEVALKALPDYSLNEYMVQAFEGKIPFVEIPSGSGLVVLDPTDLASEYLRRNVPASFPLTS